MTKGKRTIAGIIIFVALSTVFFLSHVHAAAPTNGLVGYWNFNEGSGTTAGDTSGNNNNGALTNGPTWTSGKVGSGAVSFDGTNDYVDLGNPNSLIPGSGITMSAWIKLSSTSGNQFVIAKDDSTAPVNDTFIRYQANTGIFCEVGGTGAAIATNVSTGVWYHWACTYDGANIISYVNGAEIHINGGEHV